MLALVLACALPVALWVLFTPRPPLLDGISFSTAVYDRNGVLLRLSLTQDERYRVFTPLKHIAPQLREATLLYEDRYFFRHWGVNPAALLRAAACTYLGGSRRMGASTITMQLARMRLGLETSTIPGKLRQIERAMAYERYYTKEQIFEAYLNLAPYGGNIEGCGAASAIYYHKKAEKLNLVESLSLAVVPQNPGRRSPMATDNAWAESADMPQPDGQGGRVIFAALTENAGRQNEQGGRAEQDKPLPSDAPLRDALKQIFQSWLDEHPSDIDSLFLAQKRLKTYSPRQLPFLAPHAATEALQTWPGATAVQLTLDLRRQKMTEDLLQAMVRRNAPLGIRNASVLLVHWPTMEIRALAGSANFFDASIQGQVDGTRAKRSPGSTLKPFIYALALDQGLIHPRSLLYDTPRSFSGYEPENADQRFQGPLAATAALRASRNIPAITLANQLRNPDLFGFLQSAGLSFPYTREHYGLALVLGGAEVNMRELASLYAMLPNGGELRELKLYKSATAYAGTNKEVKLSSATGTPTQQKAPASNTKTGVAEAGLFLQAMSPAGQPSHKPPRLLSPEAALLTMHMISIPPPQRTFSNAGAVKHMVGYWKTGTSNGMRDAWSAGIIGPYVLVVWVGNFDNASNPYLVGATMAAPLFWDIAEGLWGLENMPDPLAVLQNVKDGVDVPGLNLRKVSVCAGTGDVNNDLCPEKTKSWFIPGVSPIADSGVYREILVDKASGMRACIPDPEKTEKVVWEFWPTDLLHVFHSAGIMKKSPPPFLPECGFGASASGSPPEIISPPLGLTYHRSATHPEGSVMMLHASGDADTTEFFWFCGDSFIGRTTPQDNFVWTPPGGRSLLKVIDNFGRSSSREIVVTLSE